ncbi:MAG TPA: DUF6364 family protein [Cytophagaceae bacterium]|jgi:hypothetical protein|nr:DUF6364 family protein [Cytophagaceae bacterium]
MDNKITLSFDETVINKAKAFAESHHISLSRLTELLFRKITEGNYQSLEELPISDWVNTVSEGSIEYKTKAKSRKDLKKDFFDSKK